MSCKPFYEGQQFESLRDLARYLSNENNEESPKDISFEDYFSNIESELDEDNILIPNFEKKIQQLENSRERVLQRLSILKQQKARESTNAKVLTDAIKEENKLHGFLDEINESLMNLKGRGDFDDLYIEIERDVKKLEKLVNSENDIDLEEARELINFYTSLRPYRDNGYDNPFFTDEQIYDENKNLKQEFKEFFDNYEEFINRADIARKRLEDSEKNKITKITNEDKRVKDTFGKELTKEEILGTRGLKDVNILSAFFMDPEFQFGLTNEGINGILAQISRVVLEDLNFDERQIANYINQKLKTLEPDASKVINILFGKGIVGNTNWNIFRKKTANGLYSDSVIQRFTNLLNEEENKFMEEIYGLLSKIRKEVNPTVRNNNLLTLRRSVFNWHRKRNIFIDFRKIGSIVSDEKLSGLFEGKQNVGHDTDYENYLKGILGENGFNEEIEKQRKRLREYIVRLQIFHEDNLELSQEAYTEELIKFKNSHDPFIFIELANNYEKSASQIPPLSINYARDSFVHRIPRKFKTEIKDKIFLKETEEETGYYEKDFEAIDNNESLKAFHELLIEFLQYLHDNIPPSQRKNINPWSLPFFEKSFIEILRSPEITLLTRVSKALWELWKKLCDLFLSPLESQLTFSRIDPVTGNILDKVNTDFLRFNKPMIDKELARVLTTLKINLKLDPLSPIGNIDIDKADPLLLVRLADILNTSADAANIKKFFSTMDPKKFNVEEAFGEAITHSIIINQTIDLPKVMRFMSFAMTLTVARQKALPLLNNIKKQYLNIKQPVTNDSGEELKDKKGNSLKPQKTRHYAEMQYENWFNRKVLGNHGKKIGMSPLVTEQLPKIGIRGLDKLIDKLKGKKITEEDYTEKLQELRKEYERKNELTGGVDEVAINNIAKLDKLIKKSKTPRRYLSFVRTMESIFELVRWLGLSYNLNTALTNFFEGQFSNFINMNKYFSEEIFSEATDVVKYALVRNYTFKKIKSTNSPILKEKFRKAELARGLMDNFDVLQDAYNELQKASVQSRIEHLNKFNSKEIVSRTEFLNQTPVFLAVLMDTKIDEDGTSLWEAYLDGYEKTGIVGKFSEKFSHLNDKYLIDNTKKEISEEIIHLKGKITSIITKFHGDYSEFGGNMMADTIEGTMLLMFRKWLGSYIYNLFGIEQHNIHTGQVEKGRFKSLTAGSGTVMGATIGTMVGGIPGTVIGAGIGTLFAGSNVFSKIKRDDTEGNFVYLLDLVENFKMLLLFYLGLPAKVVLGRDTKALSYSTYKNKNYEKMYNNVDYKNIKANMAQMAIVLWLTTMLLVVKGLAWDDDDEKDSKRRQIHNVVVNKLVALSDQIISFIDPMNFWDSTFSKNSIAVFRFFDNMKKTLVETIHYINGDDMLLSGSTVGQSALWNQFEKTFLPSPLRGVFGEGDYLVGFEKLAERQFTTTPFDRYYHNSEYVYKKELRKAKLEEKKELNYSELSEEEKKKIDSKLNKKYRKEGSYEKTFKKVVGED